MGKMHKAWVASVENLENLFVKLHENEKYSTCMINDCFHIAFGSNCSGSRLQFLFMKTLCLCILASYRASQPGAIIQREPPSSGVKFTILFFQSHLCPGKICVPSSASSFEVFLVHPTWNYFICSYMYQLLAELCHHLQLCGSVYSGYFVCGFS